MNAKLTAHPIASGALCDYINHHETVEITYDDVDRWTTFQMWRDSRTFLQANLKDGRMLIVIQKENPDQQRHLAKIAAAFRGKPVGVGFVRSDLTSTYTDALAAITAEDLAVYDRLVDDIKQARRDREARCAALIPEIKAAEAERRWDDHRRLYGQWQNMPLVWPAYDRYPQDSVERLRKVGLVQRDGPGLHTTLYKPEALKLRTKPKKSS